MRMGQLTSRLQDRDWTEGPAANAAHIVMAGLTTRIRLLCVVTDQAGAIQRRLQQQLDDVIELDGPAQLSLGQLRNAIIDTPLSTRDEAYRQFLEDLRIRAYDAVGTRQAAMNLLEHSVRTADAAYAELAGDGSTRLLSTAIIPPEARYH